MKEIKIHLYGGNGLIHPKDVNGNTIKEGSILTFDWFDNDYTVEKMRSMFTSMSDWSEERIYNLKHSPYYLVKKNKDGIFYGEGIAPPRNRHSSRSYLHDFRFKYTKLVN